MRCLDVLDLQRDRRRESEPHFAVLLATSTNTEIKVMKHPVPKESRCMYCELRLESALHRRKSVMYLYDDSGTMRDKLASHDEGSEAGDVRDSFISIDDRMST